MHRASHSNNRRGRGGRGGRRGGWGRGFLRGGPNNLGRFDNIGTPGGGNPAANGTYGFSNAGQDSARARLFARGYYLPKHIFHHFNPKATECDPKQLGTINTSEDKPDAIAYALIYTANQMHWMDDNTLYLKSHLDLLPGYAEKKAVLVANHQEMDYDQVMDGISARLTETIKFGRYGIEDGPDIECFDEDGNISSLIVPGDWMDKSFELPKAATVGSPSVAYAPGHHEPFAVYAGNGSNPDRNGFKFIAWFFIEKIELFAANSVALARKMHAEKWEADVNREWAVVKLQKIEKGEPEWRFEPTVNRDLITRHEINHTDGRLPTTILSVQPPKGANTSREPADQIAGALLNELGRPLPPQDDDSKDKGRHIIAEVPRRSPLELLEEILGPADCKRVRAANGSTNGDEEKADTSTEGHALPPQGDGKSPMLPAGFPVELFHDVGRQDGGIVKDDKDATNGDGEEKEDVAKEDAEKEDAAKADAAKEDVAKKDNAKENTAKEDTAKEDTAKEDTAKEDQLPPQQDDSKDTVGQAATALPAGFPVELFHDAGDQTGEVTIVSKGAVNSGETGKEDAANEARRPVEEEARGHVEEEARDHTKKETNGEAKEEADGKLKEEADGKLKEEADGQLNEEADGKLKKANDEKEKEEADGELKKANDEKEKEEADGELKKANDGKEKAKGETSEGA